MIKQTIKCAALLSALALVLSGCAPQGETIIVDPIDDAQIAAQYGSQGATYQSPGYYAPSVMSEDTPIVPAPATHDEILRAAAEAAYNPSAGPASIYAPDIARGDINMGIVMGTSSFDINPYRCLYQDPLNLLTQVFEGLIGLDANQQPTAQLAESWEMDGNTILIKLRSNIRFHDGSWLTPSDVVASYEELKQNTSAYWYPSLSMIRGIQVQDESSLKVTAATKGYMALYALTFPIVQRDSMQSEIPIGTGPYLISNYSAGNAIRLEINPNWWKHSNGTIKSIVGLVYTESQAAIRAMESREIDTLATEYPTASIGRALSDRTTIDYSTRTYECIVPNLSNPILRDPSVREALMYGIDRPTLAQTVYTGMVQESEVPVVPGTWLYERQAALYTYNPERAQDILIKAGWDDNNGDGILAKEIDGKYINLQLQLYTADRGTSSTRSEACAAIQQQLLKIGIDIKITRLSHSDLVANMREGKFQLALCAFELSEVPNLYFLLNSQGDSNYARYNNGEMDQYLRAAYDAQTEDELVQQMSLIQMKVVNDLPILGLFFRSGVLSSRAPLDGVMNPRRGYVFGDIATGGLYE